MKRLSGQHIQPDLIRRQRFRVASSWCTRTLLLVAVVAFATVGGVLASTEPTSFDLQQGTPVPLEEAVEIIVPTVELTVEADAPPPTPIAPAVTITGTILSSTVDNAVTGSFFFEISGGSVDLTDLVIACSNQQLLVLHAPAESAITFAVGRVRREWNVPVTPEVCEHGETVTVLARFTNMVGDPGANELAGDGRGGWQIALLTVEIDSPVRETATPTGEPEISTGTTPVAIDEATTPEPETTPTPIAEPTLSPRTKREPAVEVTPEPVTPEPTADSASEPVIAPEIVKVTARSDNAVVMIGESLTYLYRVTNLTERTITVRLETVDSISGWVSTLDWSDVDQYQTDMVILIPRQSVYIHVTVTPPANAYLSDTNTTRIIASVIQD